MFALYPRSGLAKDAGLPVTAAGSGEVGLGRFADSRDAVDQLLRRAEAAGARLKEAPRDRPWGIYSGSFEDPDGHLWEVIWNPKVPREVE
jgi:uncharacterized protein